MRSSLAPDSVPLPGLDAVTVEKILVAFLRDELRAAGLEQGVLGLSGGIDSAVVAALAARALGPSNVTGVLMPAATSSADSLEDAQAVAAATGIHTRVVPIAAMAAGYLDQVPNASPLRRGNVYARCRMIVLYDLSAELGALVLGTSNKAELLLGYGTLHGDLASAINPIGDLYKTQVRLLAAHLDVPERVRTKAPSADLWVGQSDEADLGASYEDLDRLLSRLVDERVAPDRLIEEGFESGFVRRIARQVRVNQYKRRPPVIAKLSTRTIGPDFRYPRDGALARDRRLESAG
ncbi:MAG: NAD+ synthase [bacterium]